MLQLGGVLKDFPGKASHHDMERITTFGKNMLHRQILTSFTSLA